MRNVCALLFLLGIGCSTAPIAGLLDWVRPGRQRGPGEVPGMERLPPIPLDPLTGPTPIAVPKQATPIAIPDPKPIRSAIPPGLDPPSPDPLTK